MLVYHHTGHPENLRADSSSGLLKSGGAYDSRTILHKITRYNYLEYCTELFILEDLELFPLLSLKYGDDTNNRTVYLESEEVSAFFGLGIVILQRYFFVTRNNFFV